MIKPLFFILIFSCLIYSVSADSFSAGTIFNCTDSHVSYNFTTTIEFTNITVNNTCMVIEGGTHAGGYCYTALTDTMVQFPTIAGYPSDPLYISPFYGDYNTNVWLSCIGIIDPNNQTISYDFQANYTLLNGTVTNWVNLTVNRSKNNFNWNIYSLPNQNDTSIRCRGSDNESHYTAWSDVSYLNILHKETLSMNKLSIFSNFYTNEITPFSLMCDTSKDNNTYISSTYSDCNNDGYPEYMFDHNKTLTNRSIDYFHCSFAQSGNQSMSVGCLKKRINESLPWSDGICSGLEITDLICNTKKSYYLEVDTYE